LGVQLVLAQLEPNDLDDDDDDADDVEDKRNGRNKITSNVILKNNGKYYSPFNTANSRRLAKYFKFL